MPCCRRIGSLPLGLPATRHMLVAKAMPGALFGCEGTPVNVSTARKFRTGVSTALLGPRYSNSSPEIVLQGASHVGKTQFALAHFKRPLLVTRMDDLKYISLSTDGLVFDQMRFTHPEDRAKLNLTADELINLLDKEVSRSIGARR